MQIPKEKEEVSSQNIKHKYPEKEEWEVNTSKNDNVLFVSENQ